MSFQEQICSAFCDTLIVTEVPVSFSISTSVSWFSGETLSFYARVEGNRGRFEDSGNLLFDLECNGVNLETGSRREILDDLLHEHDVSFEEDDSLFCTDWMPISEITNTAMPFLTFLTRVQDLLFLSREIVKSTFREDLVRSLEETLERERVFVSKVLIDSLPHHTVDIVVRGPHQRTAAFFPATSDANVLRAVLFSMEIQKNDIPNIIPFLIYENLDKRVFTHQSHEIAINSDLTLGSWHGCKVYVMVKVQRQIQ